MDDKDDIKDPLEEGELPLLDDDILEDDVPLVEDELGLGLDTIDSEGDEDLLLIEEDPDGNY